jgi:hypothetical protein
MRENTSNKILWLPAICLLLLVFSCKAKKQLMVKQAAPIDSAVKPADTKKSKLDAIRAAQTQFNSFSGKARTVLNINGSSNDVTLNIRIKRDQKIWVSITAIAGIEAARVLITPDSILIINRLQSIFVKQPFSYINSPSAISIQSPVTRSIIKRLSRCSLVMPYPNC